MKNKGFSLVELIIVVAIMGILIGVLAPSMIKYVNRTKVAADVQICDGIREAIVLSMNDPEVLTANDGSIEQINKLTSGGSSNQLEMVFRNEPETAFTRNVKETLGYDVFTKTTYQSMLKTDNAKSGGIIECQMYEGKMWVWICFSDMSGKNQNIMCTRASDVVSKGVIYAN